MSEKKRVLVAMSGGVDSSVAAALLLEQGYEVIGVTMQVWDYANSSCNTQEGYGTCCSSIDVDDARAVADRLNFPFYVINCESKFETTVINPFVEAYLQGQTPVPCINCNTFLKFDHLLDKMRDLQCDYLATGHYARIERDGSGQAHIITSADDWKDQTYFLFTMNPEVISKLLFPVGSMKKDEVRSHAERFGLANARKKDSTGICFVGRQGYDQFIESRVAKDRLKSGVVRFYPSGDILCPHDGIHRFTYGQRKGLGCGNTGDPVYVLKIDAITGDVWVGPEQYLYRDTMEIIEANWLDRVEDGERLRVKIRFHHPGAMAKVKLNSRGACLEFEEPQRAITPGQAAVAYRDRQLVGGGWIV